MYLTFKNLLNTLCLCFRRHCKSEECTGSISKNDDENGEEGMRVNSRPQRHWQPEPEEASESKPIINVLPSPVLQSGPASLVLHGETTVDDPRPAAATGKSTPVFTCLGPDQYDEVPFPVHRAYQISVVELEDALFDTSPVSTPNMFRLLDCVRFTKERSLLIYETPDIPMVPYMTVSYPWIGVACNERVPPEGKTFELHTTASGARGDPISISILKRIFFLARVENTRFLWIDRLCIQQGDPDDREWQIQRMYTIFKRSQLCIVVPGGLQRLANVYEETPWISRAWTLLEVMAAPKADIVTKMAPTSLDEFLLSSTDPLYGMRLFGRQRHRPLLVDAFSLRDVQATDKQRYYHD
ncbi:hypothetical protein QCA50_016170 [Cerrena zonata]|uniref:Heterokaryon incompatibility domain-containing protein n=1 Tax=Cerrena zonata TaxID=2478898 RepID=A0AAW0FVX6_9APHY